jgi:hypothetical protein
MRPGEVPHLRALTPRLGLAGIHRRVRHAHKRGACFAQRGELQSRILARQLRRDQLQSISVSQEHLHGLSLPPKVRGRVSVVLDLPAFRSLDFTGSLVFRAGETRDSRALKRSVSAVRPNSRVGL